MPEKEKLDRESDSTCTITRTWLWNTQNNRLGWHSNAQRGQQRAAGKATLVGNWATAVDVSPTTIHWQLRAVGR